MQSTPSGQAEDENHPSSRFEIPNLQKIRYSKNNLDCSQIFKVFWYIFKSTNKGSQGSRIPKIMKIYVFGTSIHQIWIWPVPQEADYFHIIPMKLAQTLQKKTTSTVFVVFLPGLTFVVFFFVSNGNCGCYSDQTKVNFIFRPNKMEPKEPTKLQSKRFARDSGFYECKGQKCVMEAVQAFPSVVNASSSIDPLIGNEPPWRRPRKSWLKLCCS